jgi:hypothetical protein
VKVVVVVAAVEIGKKRKFKFWLEKVKCLRPFGDLGLGKKLILKCMLKE